MGATTVHLSFEQFEALPDTPGKQELLEGELIELPPCDYAARSDTRSSGGSTLLWRRLIHGAMRPS